MNHGRHPGESRGPVLTLCYGWIPAFAGMTTLLFFLANFASAQPSVSIRTEVNPREMYIGDRVEFHLFVTVSSDVAFQPITLSTGLGNFEILAVATPTVTVTKEGKITNEARFLLTTFSTGPQVLPALILHFATPNAGVSEAKTEEVTIKVRSILEEKGDEGDIRPLKGLFDFKSYIWVWILLGILLLAGILYLLYKRISARGGKLTGEPLGPPRPPEELAWEAIHTLEDSDLLSSGQTKEFYFQLSSILRVYLENRYEISALDRTTSELLAEFRRQNFTLMLSDLARNFLDNADLVKFAKFTPENSDIEEDLNRVKQFVNLTTPKKEAPTPEKILV